MQKTNSRFALRSALVAVVVTLSACVSGGQSSFAVAAPAEQRTLLLAANRNDRQSQSYSEFRCLALNLYWEARGEGERGMTAVGWVVLNRVSSPEFPTTVCGVVYQGGEAPPCQFSWWCDGRSDRPTERESWREAQAIAAKLLRAPPADPTRGSLFYHATSIRSPWLRKRQRTAQIGRHVFYR